MPALQKREERVTSVVSLRAFANSTSVPIVVFAGRQPEYPAPRLPAIPSHALDGMSADQVHRAVSKPPAIDGDVYETADWIESTLPSELGHGKNAGG
jgi:hypothetical protein